MGWESGCGREINYHVAIATRLPNRYCYLFIHVSAVLVLMHGWAGAPQVFADLFPFSFGCGLPHHQPGDGLVSPVQYKPYQKRSWQTNSRDDYLQVSALYLSMKKLFRSDNGTRDHCGGGSIPPNVQLALMSNSCYMEGVCWYTNMRSLLTS